ncbi:DUF3592 domain-containing protein [Micromonospora cathayae]|uniref:DUF3592 domain-containing protein n=1 Tax=Micromonospora cathayae TaxID=3028804 RepID=A0ABY7ZJA7_9ACTN|nr:DUF3592 domain-containing protein [Micromonospora sp. HUAS 3]WDZ82178.1 DUF3592 domain-containing protein [Micromonospora sp. HUAS 3]
MGWRQGRRQRRKRRLRSRWLPGYWLRHPWCSALALAVGTTVFGYLGVESAHHTYRLNHHGVPAGATVREVNAQAREAYVVVAFTTADGRQVRAEVTEYRWHPRPRVGDAARVVYDPAAPADIVRDARWGDDYLDAWFALGLAVALGVGGGVFLVRTWSMWRENAEDWRAGRHVA